MIRVQGAVIITNFTSLTGRTSIVAIKVWSQVIAIGCPLPRLVCVVLFGILSQMQAFDSGSALLADAADDVRNGIGLVAQVAIRHIRDAEAGKTLLFLTQVQ